jgi:hypothetical protein
MVALVKERVYPIRRGDKTYWVDPDSNKILREVKGAATAGTPSNAAQQAQATLQAFLNVAPKKYYAILGNVTSGTAGGQASIVNWTQQIPIIPSFCTAVDYEVVLPITFSTGAGASATVSPYAPYCALWNQITLGGAPPWPLMEVTPWYLDYLHNKINYDTLYAGLGGSDFNPFQPFSVAAGVGNSAVLDPGPTPLLPLTQVNGAAPPGPWSGAFFTQAVSNPPLPNFSYGASVASTTIGFQFKVRQQLQRKRHLLWGAIPFGDPENRPNQIAQIAPLTGTLPEQNVLININNTVNASIATGCTVKAIYELAYIDLLPPGMNAPPAPGVAFGIQLVPSTTQGLTAGNIFPITHRTAMAYTHIHHIMVNNQFPLRVDYFGLWDDQDQQSARWVFDANVNTQNQYWTRYKDTYRRYPLYGHYIADLADGLFPEIPSVTPYDAIMSPDASYAQAFGTAVTPAMTTALRIPTGTSTTNPYARNYEFGLVRVPY